METSSRTLKVLCSDYLKQINPRFITLSFDMAVIFCEDVFEYTESIQDADIIPVDIMGHPTDEASLLEFFKLFTCEQLLIDIPYTQHIGEGHSSVYNHNNKVLHINKILNLLEYHSRPGFLSLGKNRELKKRGLHDLVDNIEYTDFLWNRQCCFFVTQPKKVFTHPGKRNNWYPYRDSQTGEINADIYKLSNLNSVCVDSDFNTFSHRSILKKYLAPCKYRDVLNLNAEKTGYYNDAISSANTQDICLVFSTRDAARKELVSYLKNWPGYYNDSADGNILISQAVDDATFRAHLTGHGGFDWAPIHNAYYESSVVSIYTETVLTHAFDERNTVTSATEKTWNPLIKGHFILPFGHCGFISMLKNDYKIEFPAFIDYSYDSVPSDLERWLRYKYEVARVLNMPSKELWDLKKQHKDMMQRNRDLFYQGYRDSVVDALVLWSNREHSVASKSKDKIQYAVI